MSSDPKPGTNHDEQDANYVKSQLQTQLKVGAALVVFVLVAVTAAFGPFGSPTLRTLGVVAAVLGNVSLVAAVSMHLKSEKKTITQFLVFTAIFIVVLFGLTMLAFFDSTGHHH